MKSTLLKTQFTIAAISISSLGIMNAQTNVPPPPPPPPPVSEQSTNAVDTSSAKKIYSFVDQQPEFPGGVKAMMTYLGANINYPREAIEKGIEGKVYIKFLITSEGDVSNVVLMRGIGGGCDEEAIRVIQNMPDWKPGCVDKKPVDVWYTIPILFNLDDGKKEKDENKD